jgi:hypothetical protein
VKAPGAAEALACRTALATCKQRIKKPAVAGFSIDHEKATRKSNSDNNAFNGGSGAIHGLAVLWICPIKSRL